MPQRGTLSHIFPNFLKKIFLLNSFFSEWFQLLFYPDIEFFGSLKFKTSTHPSWIHVPGMISFLKLTVHRKPYLRILTHASVDCTWISGDLDCLIRTLLNINGNRICLFNIRSYYSCVNHFHSNNTFTNCSWLVCLTETYTDRQDRIGNYTGEWKKPIMLLLFARYYNNSQVRRVVEVL